MSTRTPDPVESHSLTPAYETTLGRMFQGSVEQLLASEAIQPFVGRVNLILTSPPFPLNTKKRYGNLQGQAYVDWLADLAPRLSALLTPTGSIVVEIGNSWEPGRPVMSTLALRSLLAFMERGALHLCQQFVCHNPARLPTPAQWVNIERTRVKDSFTHIWWMSPTERPKADNRRVLRSYTSSMLRLLKRQSYNSGKRPSGHAIGKTSFLTNNKGAIPPNVFFEPENLLVHSNTKSYSSYLEYCRAHKLVPHPARMQEDLVSFFIEFLTTKGDLVFDPFAGSNTTGATAERLSRKWLSVEPTSEFIESSHGRFPESPAHSKRPRGAGNK